MGGTEAVDAPRPCPFCGEGFEGTPRLCPHCEEDLTGALAGSIARRIAEETREDVAAGAFEPPPRGALRRVRIGTIVAASCLGAALLMCFVAFHRKGGQALGLLWLLGVLGGIPALITTLFLGLQDLLIGDPGKTGNPLASTRLWTRALLHKRWGLAWHLTLPRGRVEARPLALRSRLGLRDDDMDFSTVKGFRDAWKAVLHSTEGIQRKASFSRFTLDLEEGDYAEVSCLLTTKTRDAVVGITNDTDNFPLVIRLLRVGGDWYVVDGAPGPEQPLEE